MPRYVDHDERLEGIVDLAAHLIAEYGLADVSFSRLAERAGASTTNGAH